MNSNTTSAAPRGKYNRWCEKRPLERRQWYRYNSDLTYSANAAFFLHETVGCEGLEFVVFSNAQIEEPIIELPGNITLIPCFILDLEGTSINDELSLLTEIQMGQSRYIYDGWVPISDWRIEAVNEAIEKIDQVLSLFSLLVDISITWEPKYPPTTFCKGLGLTCQHVHAIKVLKCITESLNEDDSTALFKSIAWLSQSFKLSETTAKFLFCFLAIESLATYIEIYAKDNSIFKPLRSFQISEEEYNKQRDDCIRAILDLKQYWDKCPMNAIQRANSECVKGTRQRLENHMEIISAEDPLFDLLFKTKVDGKTLYHLRNKIAHGGMNALSQKERERVSARLWDVERLARRYIHKVLEFIESERICLSIELPKPDISWHDLEYRGDFHMAKEYRDHL
jgi:hypothetical protein